MVRNVCFSIGAHVWTLAGLPVGGVFVASM
jgi:hypothetical protein